ncbi:MAG: heavy metal response regulator transcription factor [Bacteroidetes bacterium]|nr:heavy metal response regulator transcription factor [Bacteroidota bacterium]
MKRTKEPLATILIIEDEKKISALIRKGLEEEKYAVDEAADGEKGEHHALQKQYDLIILDIMLPKKDGIQVLAALRKVENGTPVLMLTAKGTVEDRVKGLDTGADDYLVKPFAITELLARVRSLLRRKKGAERSATTLTIADLTLDLVARKVIRGGKVIDLTSKEFSLLEYFIRNKNKTLNRSTITEHIWNYNFDTGTNIIDVYINHLRTKIDGGFPDKLLHTIRGVGYVLKDH